MSHRPVSDAWGLGDPYERYVGRWSRTVAPPFLRWLNVEPGLRWLDVGCGTGALSSAILAQAAPSSVTGVDPSEGFLETARARLAGRVVLHDGHAAALPLPDASFDVVVSGLVLNFVPQPQAALAEWIRVSERGATIAAYVWDYAEGMQMMRHFWDAAIELDPQAASLDESARFPLCRPGALEALFTRAGLVQIEVTALVIPTRFSGFDDFWTPFLGGQGPAPAYAMSLSEPQRERLRERIRARLSPGSDGPIELTARAWAIRSSLPGT